MDFSLSQVMDMIKYAGTIKEILDVSRSNGDIASKIGQLAKPVVGLLTDIGSKLFPQASDKLHAVGGAIAAFDPNTTKWIQGAANSILNLSPPLDVDGIYGPKTRDAVLALQKKLGVEADGLAGRITQAAIDLWFSKQEATAKVA